MLAHLSDYLKQQSISSYLNPDSSSRTEMSVGARQPSVSNMSTMSTGRGSQLHQTGHNITRLPSFIPVPYQIADIALAHTPSSVLRVMGTSPLLFSDLPLHATIEKLTENIPTVWKKVGVACTVTIVVKDVYIFEFRKYSLNV